MKLMKTAAALAIVATLSACGSMNNGLGMDMNMTQSQRNTAAGAVIGGLAGKVFGGDAAATLGGAALGGVIGSQLDQH